MSIAGKLGAVFIDTGAAPIVFTDEPTTGNTAFTRYAITDTGMRYWDKGTPVLVEVSGSSVLTGFSIEYAGGVVVFDTPLGELDVVTVSGAHLTVDQAGGFFNWTSDLGMDISEITSLGNDWKEHLATVKEFRASAEKYWGNEDFFDRLGSEMIIVLYIDPDTIKARYEGFGIIDSDGVEVSVDDVINETIEIQGTGPLYYREG